MNRTSLIHEVVRSPQRARIRFAVVLLVVVALMDAAVAHGQDVNSTADDGAAGTLRVAIEAANASSGSSTIRIFVGSEQTITLAPDPVAEPPRLLPIGITQPLTIDANSSLGLTLTRTASSGDNFDLTADTTFVDVAKFTNGGISISSGVNLTLTQSSQAGEISSVLSGSGALTKDGTNTLTLSGKNSWAGGTTITGGELVIPTGDSLPKSSAAGIADVTVEKNGILNFTNTSAASYSYTGSIDGGGKLVKAGTGTVELSGPTAGIQNDWQGGTEILEGTLKVTRLSSLPQTGTTDVNISGSSGILELHMKTNGTYNGVVSGRGQLKKSGTAQLTLGSINTYTGGTAVTEGILLGKWIGKVSTLGSGGVTLSSGATLELDTGGVDETLALHIGGEGGLTKSGSHELTLSGSNSYSGGTTIKKGTLRGTTSSIPKTVSFNGGSRLTFGQAFDGTHGGAITGIGAVHIDSAGFAVTLAGQNSYQLGTFLDAGDLVVTTSSLPVLAGRPFTNSCINGHVDPDACLATGTNLTFSETTDATWLGLIDGHGSVSKRGSGALTFRSAQPYTGSTTVSEGTLFVGGSLASDSVVVSSGAILGGAGTLHAGSSSIEGTIAPGTATSMGRLTIEGDVTFGDASSLTVRVDD
ncbi:MAG: autotransporter-associated beta strand repeat-containing protein, partial [Myxococcota bacterium]